MFPVDSLAPQYCEERSAAEAAKRLLKQQQSHNNHKTSGATSSTTHTVQPTMLSSCSLAHQRPALSRGPSSGFIGSLFQSFAKSSPGGLVAGTMNYNSAGRGSGASTPAVTPPASEKSEAEAMSAEAQRDADICAMRAW